MSMTHIIEEVPTYAQWKERPRQTWLQERLVTFRAVPAWKWTVLFAVVALLAVLRWQNLVERGEPVIFVLLLIPLHLLIGLQVLTMGSIVQPSPALLERAKNEQRECFLVKMTVHNGEHPIGQDEGLVFFVEDELIYEGFLTSFRIATGDVDAQIDMYADGPLMRAKDEQWKFGNLDGKAAWGFLLRDHPDIRVNFFPLEGGGRSSIYQPLFAWLRREPAIGTASVFPPKEPLPGLKQPSILLKRQRQKA